MSARGGRFLVPVLLALYAVALFWPLVLTNRILVGIDFFNYFVPYWDYAAEALRQGRLPLWNPYLFLGVPFLANPPVAVLYPLHWPLRLLLWPPRALAASFVLHVWLGGLFTYALARRSLGLGRLGALVAAVVWMGSGYVGGQAEHISHLSTVAWLPLTMLLLDLASPGGSRPLRWNAVAGLGLVIALMLLAGHTQLAYISLCGLGLYALRPSVIPVWMARHGGFRAMRRQIRWQPPVAFGIAAVLGLMLAAVQLLPTLELSRLSIRSDGLTYREAVSFSLRPRALLYTLLPAYGQSLEESFGTPAFTEFVAFVGIIGLTLAAVGARGALQARRGRFFVALALVGLALAFGGYNPFYFVLYKVLPGFGLFRVPARWLVLYTLSLAFLAGIGAETLTRTNLSRPHLRGGILIVGGIFFLVAIAWLRKPDLITWVFWGGLALPAWALAQKGRWPQRLRWTHGGFLVMAVAGELWLAGRTLPHAHPTAPEALSSLRTATAALLRDPGLWRFLSMSGLTFDTGDLPEIKQLFAGRLTEKEIYDFTVATKEKEILAPNLPLLYRVAGVDGYDGGVLPLRRYVQLQRLFLSPERLSPDGRLREQLQEIPPSRLLNLLNIKYVITDKVYDLWLDDVYYDLEQSAVLEHGGMQTLTVAPEPTLSATALGVVSHLRGGAHLPDGAVVGEIILTDAEGREERLMLRAGIETAEGAYGPGVAHRQARIGHNWRDDPNGHDYVAVMPFSNGPMTPLSVTLQSVAQEGSWVVRGMSLVDARTGAHRPVLASTEQRLRRVHSGDVKVYENLELLPRAYVVHRARVFPDDETALAALADPAFNPATQVILSAGEALSDSAEVADEAARVITYEPERVAVEATLARPGYLVLADTYYPGWRATVDGTPVTIQRANLLFRAVYLTPGQHRVVFIYAPDTLRWGAMVSGIGWVILTGMLIAGYRAKVAGVPRRSRQGGV